MFTADQLELGVEFLIKKDCYYLFNNVKMPDEWHSEGAVVCLDLLSFHLKPTFVYDGKVLAHDDESIDNLKHEVVEYVKCICSCYDLSCYIYELLIYVKTRETSVYKGEEIAIFFEDKDLCDKIKRLGGKVTNQISEKTYIVIYQKGCNDGIEEAIKFGKTLMEKDKFLSKIMKYFY